MIGQFIFQDIEIKTILWVYDYEKIVRTFYVDLTLGIDIWNSYYTDKLEDTIDTWSIKTLVIEGVKWKNYNLLEKICYDISLSIKDYDPRIISVKTTVKKDGCIDNVKSVSFTIDM